MYKAFFYSADFTTGRSVVVKITLVFFCRNSARKNSNNSQNSNEIVDVVSTEEMVCEWEGCDRNFSTQKALVEHVSTAHIQVFFLVY